MGIINSIQINIDYAQLIAQAGRLEQAADTCNEGTVKLASRTGDMRSYWQGDAADAAFLKLVELHKENIKLQQELREMAAQVRRIAESIKQSDDSAAADIRGGSGRF